MSDAFACPECGSTETFRALYNTPTEQSCNVEVGPDGNPQVSDYTGFETGVNEYYEPQQDEAIECECGWHYAIPATPLSTEDDSE